MWSTLAMLGLFLFQAANPVEDGLKALDAQNYAAAAESFEKALEADPDNYGILFNLAFAHSMLDKPEEAIAGYEKVLELKPGLYEASLNLGVLLLDCKEPERALPHLKAAQEQKPAEFRPNFYLGQAMYGSGDDAGAEQYFGKAVALDPKSPDAEIGLARSIINQGRLDEAQPHYERAVELDPGYHELLIELASRLEEKGASEKAIELYRQFPENPAVRERLGHLLLRAGKVEEALPHLEFAVQKSPTAANRFALAMAYSRMKQFDKSAALLQLALQEAPDNFEMRMMYGRIIRDRRNFGAAAQEFLRAVQVKPDSKEAWSELASVLILLESYPQALAALDRVEALGKPPVGIHFLRAIILDKARMYEPALASYEKYLELSDGSSEDEEFKARQRIIVIKKELNRR